jgi:hypothetical protein
MVREFCKERASDLLLDRDHIEAHSGTRVCIPTFVQAGIHPSCVTLYSVVAFHYGIQISGVKRLNQKTQKQQVSEKPLSTSNEIHRPVALRDARRDFV